MTKALSTLQKQRIGAFEVISRSARHRAIQDALPEPAPDLHTYEFDAALTGAWERVYELKRPTQLAAIDLSTAQAGTFVSAHIASLLARFVQTTAIDSPRLVVLESRLDRVEKALRRAGIECTDDERREVDWRDPQVVIETYGLVPLVETCERILRELFGEGARVAPQIERDPASPTPSLVLRLVVPRSLRNLRHDFLSRYGRETVIPQGAPVPVLLWEYHDAVPA